MLNFDFRNLTKFKGHAISKGRIAYLATSVLLTMQVLILNSQWRWPVAAEQTPGAPVQFALFMWG
jgi:hypothetical protein